MKIGIAKTHYASDQMKLGELIEAFEEIVAHRDEDRDEPPVRFDFGYVFPTDLDSWRGRYDELALNYTCKGEELTVTRFLELLKSAVGKQFTGYKGGKYTMTESTPIWVSNYGEGFSTVIGVIDRGYVVILITGYREF